MFKKKWALHAVPVTDTPLARSLAESCNADARRYRTKYFATSAAIDMTTAYFGLIYVIVVVPES